MRPKSLLLAFCSLVLLLASPSLADETQGEAEDTLAPMFAPAGCGTLTTGTPEPLFLTGCSVQVECAAGNVVSCTGNSTCSTNGLNNRCVICDGVQGACCPMTCCEQCAANYEACDANCPDWPLACARGCSYAYNNCRAGCDGGCP